MSQPGSERRQWPRVPASSLSHITASVVAGPAVQLVNLSRGGALMEVASRFPMRSRVRLKLTLATGEVTVAEGLVAWARVAAIVNKQVNYLVAIIFDNPIPDLGGLDVAPIEASAPPVEVLEAPPVIEVAPRGKLSQFPAPAARVLEPARALDLWNEATEHVVSLDSALDAPNEAKPAPAAVSQITPVNDALASQLAAADAARNALRDDLEAERRASEAERRTREDERDRLVQDIAAAAANVEALQAALAAREQEHTEALAEQQARLVAEQSGLAARDQELATALAELTEQQGWHETLQSALAAREHEHARAVAELVALRNQLEALQASMAVRNDEHALALAEQKSSYDALTAELLQASLDQQSEYQILMNERATEREAERLRAEATALEFARLEEEATQAREQLELRCFDLQARLEAAQSLCAAHEARDRGLRRELDKLATMMMTLVGTSALNQQQESKQAVA